MVDLLVVWFKQSILDCDISYAVIYMYLNTVINRMLWYTLCKVNERATIHLPHLGPTFYVDLSLGLSLELRDIDFWLDMENLIQIILICSY